MNGLQMRVPAGADLQPDVSDDDAGGNSRNGIGLSVAAIMGYTFLHMWLILWHGFTVPIIWELPEHPDRLDAGVWFGWLAVCLTLMVVTQFRFERAEV